MTRLPIYCLLFCVVLSAEPTSGWDPADGQESGVLVLRNGEVLVGRVTRIGDRYLVTNRGGVELRVPTRDVEMHCADLDEAYQRKRLLVAPGDASARLQLADWCLRCGLCVQAADELLTVQAIAPRDPRAVALQRRLQTAAAVPPQRESPAATGAPSQESARDASLARAPSPLPRKSVEQFASRIQPLLVNRCASNGCHGGRAATSLQITNSGLGQAMTWRSTQRNLATVVQQIDPAHPAASALLTVPQRAHGGLSGPVFSERDRVQLELLEDWVHTVAPALPPSPASAGGLAAKPSLDGEGRTKPKYEAAIVSYHAELPSAAQENADLNGNRVDRARAGGESSTLDFHDPFDPERFNRRFLPSPEANGLDWPAKPADGRRGSPAPRHDPPVP